VYAAPAVADTPATPPTVYVGSADHNLYALNADSGDVIWTADVGGLTTGAESVVGDVVYASAVNADLTRGFDITDGDLVFEIDRGEYNPVISDGQRIYLTGYAGITKLTPKEPKRKGQKGKKGRGKPKKKDRKKGDKKNGRH
jgi:outer membrane protein assembly factor BamB